MTTDPIRRLSGNSAPRLATTRSKSPSRSTICTFEIRGRSLPRIGSPTERGTKKSDGDPFGRIARRTSWIGSKLSRPVLSPHADTAAPNRHVPTPRMRAFEKVNALLSSRLCGCVAGLPLPREYPRGASDSPARDLHRLGEPDQRG